MTRIILSSFGTIFRRTAAAGLGIPSRAPIAMLVTPLLVLASTSCGGASSSGSVGPAMQEVQSFQAAAGDNQVGTAGSVLADPLTVQAQTKAGQGVSGVSVQWTFSNGGGSSTPNGSISKSLTTVTDQQGETSVYWQLDTIAGDQTATATFASTNQTSASSTTQIKFHSHGKAGGPNSIVLSPPADTLSIGDSTQFTATVLDRWKNVISGATLSWSSSDDSIVSVSSGGTAKAIRSGAATVVATTSGASATSGSGTSGTSTVSGQASVSVASSTASTTNPPGTVSDLKVSSVTDSSVTLQWTQVDDGTGSPSNYTLRYATPTMYWGAASATDVSVTGTSTGATESYTFEGLQATTGYQFQLVSYRGTLNVDAVFGGWSNIASGSTAGSGTLQTPTVTVAPSSLSFTSLNATAQLTAVAKDSTGNTVTNPGFTWKSLATAIATVSSTGLVTARAAGATAIIVTAACCGADTTPVAVDTSTTVASAGELLRGCTVNASNVPSCVTPSGWTLVDAQGFEPGSYNSMESAYGDNVAGITPSMGHTGTHSQDNYIRSSFTGYGIKISGTDINARDVYISYWRYVTNSNPGYGYDDTNWFTAVRATPGYGPGLGIQVDQAPTGSCCLALHGSVVVYGSIPSGPPAPWAGYGVDNWTYVPGQWQQIEVRIKANDPGAGNGEVQEYVDGKQILNCTPASGCPSVPSGITPGDLVGNTDYATGDLYIGGDWGKDVWYSDAAHTVCSTQGDMGMGPVNVNMASPQCPNQAPPNGVVPYFHIYIDDVIVLKK